MELFVKVEEGFYLNPVSGEIKSQARMSIPLSAPINVRKMKPANNKFTRKVGDVWLGSNKMSFALILAYLQLKQEKNTVIGIYKHRERYFYIEGSLDMYKQPTLSVGYTDADETPDGFLAVRGKVYDAIFGTTDVRNITFDIIRAYRELLQRVQPLHIAALLVCLILIGYSASVLFQRPPKVVAPKVIKQPPPPKPLTPEEINKLSLMLKNKFIEKYSEVLSELDAANGEKWLKGVTLTTTPTPDRQAIAVTFNYASFYPFQGAKKDGNGYTWAKPYGESFSREDLKAFSRASAGPYVCLKYFINYPVSERVGNRWTISLKEEKHSRIVFLMNLIYSCPCAIKDLSIDEKGLSGTVVVDGA